MPRPERSNTYCYHPFYEVTLKNWRNGVLEHSWPCCMMGDNKEGVKEFEIDDLQFLTPEEIFNSERMKTLRKNALNGVRDPACKTCWDIEDRGLTSPRLRSKFADGLQLKKDQLSLDVTATNECNLSCRMCTPTASHQLMKDWKFFDENDLMEELHENAERFEASYPLGATKTKQWAWMEENTDKIGILKASGGEPFYDTKMIRLLEKFVKQNTDKDCSLKFHTNGTQYTEEICNFLKSFKSVANVHSIDGVNSVYEFIRHPQVFSELEESMKRFIELPNRKITSVTLILDAYNLFNVPDWIRWIYSMDNKAAFRIAEVYPRSRGIHIVHLSKKLLEQAKAEWVSLLKEMQLKTDYFDKNSLLHAIEILDWAIENNQENPVKVLKEIKLFDMSRKQDYKKFLDEPLVNYLLNYEKELDKTVYRT